MDLRVTPTVSEDTVHLFLNEKILKNLFSYFTSLDLSIINFTVLINDKPFKASTFWKCTRHLFNSTI